MTHKEKMRDYLSQYNIETDVDEFVSATSNIYHSYEARNYDERHFSITYSKKYWRKVTDYLSEKITDQSVSVLDFGCGTGFAADQILHSGLNTKIGKISCYDLSEDMVAVCREKFAGDSRLSFFAGFSGRDKLLAKNEKYDIVVCNALLHHILEPESVFALIDNLLKPAGIFIMGHEPNKNFYENRALQAMTKAFRFYKKVRRRLFVKGSAPMGLEIGQLTQIEMVRKGMVPKGFPSGIVAKFVDIHVPFSNFVVQPWGENGFNPDYVNKYLNNSFDEVTQITYSHIKDQEAYKSFVWRNIAGLLSRIFPKDGADSIFIFKKRD